MTIAVFASLAPLITDYPGAPPTPAAPPAPPSPPDPPQDQPIAFSVVTRPSLFGIVGTAIASTTLATVTCADTAMTITQSEIVPGLTFSYAANVLTVAGTPTGSTKMYRVVISYVGSAGNNTIRGSTSHEITIVNASEVLTIGVMAGLSGRVGQFMTGTLCTMTSNFAVDVTAAVMGYIPQEPNGFAGWQQIELNWSRASQSGSLVLNPIIPTTAGTYTMPVEYRGNGVVIGTSTHEVVIVARFEAPAPTPAPAPAPSPPTPSPPPSPTPAPAPGMGPDPYLSSTKVLMHFDDNPGLSVDQDLGINERGNTFTNFGATQAAGATGEAAVFTGAATRITGSISGLEGLDDALTAECMIDIGSTAWGALSAIGEQTRFCPAVTYETADGDVLWALGFFSFTYYVGPVLVRTIRPVFYLPTSGVGNLQRAIVAIGPLISERPNRYVHFRGAVRSDVLGVGYSALVGVWFDGVPNQIASHYEAADKVRTTGALVRIGGICMEIQSYFGGGVEMIPFSGKIDEVRVTVVCRDSSNLNFGQNSTYALAPAARVIPWPNY